MDKVAGAIIRFVVGYFVLPVIYSLGGVFRKQPTKMCACCVCGRINIVF